MINIDLAWVVVVRHQSSPQSKVQGENFIVARIARGRSNMIDIRILYPLWKIFLDAHDILRVDFKAKQRRRCMRHGFSPSPRRK